MKPTAIIILNTKGGVRKSTLSGLIYWILRENGIDPIVVALDPNQAFCDIITIKDMPQPEIYVWDLNDIEAARNILPDLVQLANSTGRPLLIDLPGESGDTLGVDTLRKCGALRHANVVGIAPVIQTELSVAGAIRAHEIIKPAKWALVEFGKRSLRQSSLIDTLVALKPDDTVNLLELHSSEALMLATTPPVPYSKLLEYSDQIGPSACGWFAIWEFWNNARPQLDRALKVIAPDIFRPTASATEETRESSKDGQGSNMPKNTTKLPKTASSAS